MTPEQIQQRLALNALIKFLLIVSACVALYQGFVILAFFILAIGLFG